MRERGSQVVAIRNPLGCGLRIMASSAVFVAHFLAYLLLISHSDLTQVDGRASSAGFGGVRNKLVASGNAAKLDGNAHLSAGVGEILRSHSDLTQVDGRASSAGFGGVRNKLVASGNAAKLDGNAHLSAGVGESFAGIQHESIAVK